MKKYFLDSGANIGQSAKAFTRNTPDAKDYKIVCFEASKKDKLKKKLKQVVKSLQKEGYDVEIINKVVHTCNGVIKFYDMGTESSSIDKAKNGVNKTKKVKADCFDFSEYIFSLPEDAYIEMKLDIEGSEYPVVDHLHSTGALAKISKVYIELHAAKISNKKIEDDFKLVEQLADFNLESRTWNGNRQPPAGGVWTKDKIIKEWQRKKRYKG